MLDAHEPAELLASIIHPILLGSQAELRVQKSRCESERLHEDWLWRRLVISFSTLGGTRHSERNIQPYMDAYSWKNISALGVKEREEMLWRVPNPRFRSRMAPRLLANFRRIADEGGPASVQRRYDSFENAAQLFAYLKSFSGIGEKYARNIPMDVYDKRVRNFVALDHRLKQILLLAGFSDLRYEQAEHFYQGVACRLSCEVWDIDRILFKYYGQICHSIEVQRPSPSSKPAA